MERDVRERFERIESVLERVTDRLDGITERMDGMTERMNVMTERMDGMTERMDRIMESHLEIEAAQKNTTILLNRFIDESAKRGAELDERITNLTILVDQLIKRDFNGSGPRS